MFLKKRLKKASEEFFWNFYAKFYDRLPRFLPDYRHLRDAVLAEVEQRTSSGAAVLDFGCGTGAYAVPLAAAGFRVIGLDRSSAMLAIARKKAPLHADLRFLQIDGEAQTEFTERFDAIIAINVLYALHDPQVCLRRLASWLEPGGVIIAVVPCAAIEAGAVFRKMMTRDGLLPTLSTAFSLSVVFLLNTIIGCRYRKSSYHLWDRERLRQDLHDAGLVVEKMELAYLDTDLLAVAVKKPKDGLIA